MNQNERAKIKLQPNSNRHYDETFRMMSWWDAEVVHQAKVLVVGAGALGNEVLKNLALMNVGNILIVDFDTIEYANLCRSVLFREKDCSGNQRKCEVAAERIREINPNVNTKAIHGDIWLDVGLGVFRRMDVVIGCLDNRLARKFINQHCYRTGKTWIDGAIENLAGQLDVYKPWTTCYECQLTEAENRIIQYRMGCPDVAMRNATNGKIPTTPISASIIGAMQVQEAIKVIHNNERQSMAGEQFKYEGMNNMFLQFPASQLREHCESHFTIEKIIEAKELTHRSSIGETLSWLQKHFGDKQASISLDYQVILEVYGEKSEVAYPVVKAKPHFSDIEALKYQKVPGEKVVITEYVVDVENSFPKPNTTLYEIGIPPLQIITVKANNEYHYVELTGDEDFLNFDSNKNLN